MKSLSDLLEPHSHRKIFLYGILVYVIFYVILLIITLFFQGIDMFMRPGLMKILFFDFYHFYAQEGGEIVSGSIPYVDYIPFYPIIAEYYMALFSLFGQNIHVARIFQLMLVLATIWVGQDVMKLIDLKNQKVHFLFFTISIPFFMFSIYGMNFDILVVLFMLLAFDFYFRKSSALTGMFLGLGFGTKLFPIILIIPMMADLLKNRRYKDVILLLLGCIGTVVALYLPFTILATAQQGFSFTGLISNFINCVLSPMSYFDDKPLNHPFYIFQIFGVDKFLLNVIQAILAFGLVGFYCTYCALKDRPRDMRFFYNAMILFFFFQPYIMPWYFIWITVIYHLIFKESPEKEYVIHYILLIVNYLIFAIEGFFLKYYLLYNILTNEDWNYAYLLPNGFILPAIVIGLITAYIQVLALIFWSTNNWKYQK
ncbi:MAG: glycosyltransferase 87 family protein, partial [Candidatus Helarchaeales archaeon]